MTTTSTNNAQKTKDDSVDFLEHGHVHGPGCNHGHHHHTDVTPYVRSTPKIGANDPCTCGSGKKYKKCCRT